MPDVRTYRVSVDGYGECLVNARTTGRARVRAWHQFSFCRDCSFGAFLRISTIRRAQNPPGVGDRIIVCGAPATRVISHCQYIAFVRDGADEILYAHPADVSVAA